MSLRKEAKRVSLVADTEDKSSCIFNQHVMHLVKSSAHSPAKYEKGILKLSSFSTLTQAMTSAAVTVCLTLTKIGLPFMSIWPHCSNPRC